MASVPPKPGETRSLSQLEAGFTGSSVFGHFFSWSPQKRDGSGNDGNYRLYARTSRFGKGARIFHEFAERLLRVHLINIPSTLHTSKPKMRKFADDPFSSYSLCCGFGLVAGLPLGNGCSSRVWSAALSRVLWNCGAMGRRWRSFPWSNRDRRGGSK